MSDWRTKVGRDGRAKVSPRTGKPIRFQQEEGKERLPRSEMKPNRRVKGNKNLTTRIARGIAYYFHGSTDQRRYILDMEEKYGPNIMAVAKAKYEKQFKPVPQQLKPSVATLLGQRISFLDEDGKVVHGKISGIDARDARGEITEYEVDVDGDLWSITPEEIKGIFEPSRVLEVKKTKYPYHKPKKINVMLANKGKEEMLDTSEYWAEPKWDGTRGISIVTPDKITIRGRSWKTNFAPRYPEIHGALSSINATNAVLDGELVFLDKEGNDVFLTALAKKSTIDDMGLTPVYMVYDVLHVDDKDLTSLPYRERRKFLEQIIPDNLHYVRISPIIKTKQRQFWEKVVKRKGDGIMLKDPDSPYRFKRSSDWLKLKVMYTAGADTYDAAIIGYTQGRGKYSKQLGSLLLVQRSGKDWVYLGRTSGMDDATRKELTKRLKKAGVPEEKMPPIYDNEGYELDFPEARVLTKPKIVVEVKAGEKTKAGILRFPSFERLRPDKRAKDATA